MLILYWNNNACVRFTVEAVKQQGNKHKILKSESIWKEDESEKGRMCQMYEKEDREETNWRTVPTCNNNLGQFKFKDTCRAYNLTIMN